MCYDRYTPNKRNLTLDLKRKGKEKDKDDPVGVCCDVAFPLASAKDSGAKDCPGTKHIAYHTLKLKGYALVRNVLAADS